MIRRLSFLFFIIFSFFACDERRVFDQYQQVGGLWHQDSIVKFSFDAPDTVKPYDLYVNLRNDHEYPFSNIYLIVSMENPEGIIRKDTLEYLMANPDGTLLGTGFSDTKESKLFYKERMRFSKSGTYKVSIQQAVRGLGKISGEENLTGISDIGFRIESIPSKND